MQKLGCLEARDSNHDPLAIATESNRAIRNLPKGPFRTKNSTALEAAVFCYRRSFLLSVHRFPASFPYKNKHF